MSETIPEQPPETSPATCPACGQALPAGTIPGLVQCAHCNEQFMLADPESITVQAAPEPENLSPPPDDDSELSGLRIHHIAAERRAAYRTRSYAIIAAGVCVVAMAQFSRIAIATWRQNLHAAAIADELAAIASLMLFGHFAKKVFHLTREIRASRQKFPIDPPDFSTLGDGTQRVAALEALAAQNSSTTKARSHEENEKAKT